MAAWNYKLARKRELKKKQSKNALARNLQALASIDTLVSFIADHKWTVNFSSKESQTFFEFYRIEINTSSSPAARLGVLLHEIGHVLLGEERPERFENGWEYAEGPKSKQNAIYVTTIIEEECAAWDRGQLLAEELGVLYDPKTFKRVKSNALLTYMKWASDKKRWTEV